MSPAHSGKSLERDSTRNASETADIPKKSAISTRWLHESQDLNQLIMSLATNTVNRIYYFFVFLKNQIGF